MVFYDYSFFLFFWLSIIHKLTPTQIVVTSNKTTCEANPALANLFSLERDKNKIVFRTCLENATEGSF